MVVWDSPLLFRKEGGGRVRWHFIYFGEYCTIVFKCRKFFEIKSAILQSILPDFYANSKKTGRFSSIILNTFNKIIMITKLLYF